jgi:hypothetical protein
MSLAAIENPRRPACRFNLDNAILIGVAGELPNKWLSRLASISIKTSYGGFLRMQVSVRNRGIQIRRIIGFGIHGGIVGGAVLCVACSSKRSGRNLFPNISAPTTIPYEARLRDFQEYFNRYRTDTGLGRQLPEPSGRKTPISFASYQWHRHCRELYQTPMAA